MRVIVISLLILCGGISYAQTTNPVGPRHIEDKVLKKVLLVLEYESLDSLDIDFSQRSITDKQVKDFIKDENKNLKENNKLLENTFKKYYLYKYKLVTSRELADLDKKEYPYVLKRTPIKVVKNGKSLDKGAFTYSYFFYNRIRDKKYADINIYSENRWSSLKILVQELGDYLQSREYEMLYE